LVVHEATLRFPKFELYELGSQVRRSSNSAAAILAEGWGSRHTNIYLEAISRSKGEVRETQHHLDVAGAKGYIVESRRIEWDGAYEACDRMLETLYARLSEWRGTTRVAHAVREVAEYPTREGGTDEWQQVVEMTATLMSGFTPLPSTPHLPPSTFHPRPANSDLPPSTRSAADVRRESTPEAP
jgi:four helix bundle protein